MERHVRRWIGGTIALLLAYLAVTGLLWWGTTGAIGAVRAPGPAAVGVEVATAAAMGAWAVLTWLTGVTLAALLTAAVAGVGSRAHDRALALAPTAAQRLAGALLGLTVAATPVIAAGPAAATARPAAVAAGAAVVSSDCPGHDQTDHARPGCRATAPANLSSLDRPVADPPRGWTPDRPASAHRRSETRDSSVRLVSVAPRRDRDPVDEVVVRRGDTLWDIAARHLGSPSAAEIAREWPRWYAANRAVIGADPDLLLPGQRLVPPRT